MMKRGLHIGNYDTSQRWTLASWELSRATQFTRYVNVPGRRRGLLDLSGALTDGDPVYEQRELTAVLECSEGTRLERKQWVDDMINELDGLQWNIVLPDDPHHYVVGRVGVTLLYNDTAHASVQVDAICEPWRYNLAETVVVLKATETAQTARLTNRGRLALVPTVTVTGEGADVLLDLGSVSYALSAGAYDHDLPALFLKRGDTLLTYSGSGTIYITYREAVL